MTKIRVTKKKNGQTVFWLKGDQGRVRIANPNRMNWIRAQQMRELGEYGLDLIRERVSKGIGSDDAPMPVLSGRTITFAAFRVGGFRSKRIGYREQKQKMGLSGIRDLTGPGKGGHMLDDIRINYFDDHRVEFGITRLASRQKARANEDRAPWWGWSPSDMKKMVAKFQEIFQIGIVEAMVSRGLAGITMATGVLSSSRRWLRRAA